jgi:hypothetical protein
MGRILRSSAEPGHRAQNFSAPLEAWPNKMFNILPSGLSKTVMGIVTSRPSSGSLILSPVACTQF